MADRSLLRTKVRETAQLLAHAREMLRWDAATGHFWWKRKPSMAVHVGDRAGSVGSKGYREICIKGTSVLAHRLMWALETGAWPTGLLDHKNTLPDDNRFKNLREATRSGNAANRHAFGKKNGGNKGVVVRKFRSGNTGFQAVIQKDGERFHLGSFASMNEAAAAYRLAAAELHGEFAFNTARDEALKECP